MDLSFPEKYHAVVQYFDLYFGNLETTPLLTDVQRLLFYALRQQAEHGPCTTPTPSMWYTTERHKHQAWKQLGRMSTFEAMVYFVQQLERVLVQLESPDADTAASVRPSPTTVNWPARLREMTTQLTPAPSEIVFEHGPGTVGALETSGGSTTAGAEAILAAATSATDQLASTVATESASPSPPQLSAEETAGWDADVVTHCSATLDSVRYLAKEVMRVRRLLQQTHPTSPPQVTSTATVESPLNTTRDDAPAVNAPPLTASSPGPSASENTSATSADAVATGPPLKPIWSTNGSTVRVPVVPPPLRPSARSMTEAAVRPPAGALHRHDAVRGAAGQSTNPLEVPISWFNW